MRTARAVLAAFLCILALPAAAQAYQVHISITGAGQVTETTSANLVGSGCVTFAANPTGTVGKDCFAGTPSGDYGWGWTVRYVATAKSGYHFAQWQSDGNPNPVICDNAGGSSTYTGSACQFATFDNLQTRAVFVDDSSPAMSSLNGPTTTVGGAATFTFSAVADPTVTGFECRVAGVHDWVACSSGRSENPATGSYTFEVRAVDASGNRSSISSWGWTVDKTPPQTTLGSGPSGLVKSSTATFGFSSNESGSFVCTLNGASTACTSPKSYPDLADGDYTFTVAANDDVGNMDLSPASSTFTVDATAPDTSISGGPTGTTTDPNASFDLVSTESGSTFRCEYDGVNVSPCTSPLSGNASVGPHTLTVWATDPAGNEDATPATRTWTVAAAHSRGSDYNGDGFQDLAVGVPDENVGSVADAGLINVQYGSAGGIGEAGAQAITQSTPDVAGFVNGGERFGAALASGDFNSDGFDDLAVGAPGDAALVPNAGSVTILFGSPTGLTGAGSRLFTQDTTGIADTGESGDGFGSALAVGDFGGSSDLDLAIGIPGEDVGAGAVEGLVGTAAGLTATDDVYLTQSSLGANPSETGDHFGAALAAGDLGKDAHDDLAIGVPGENTGTATDSGGVHLVYGSPTADFATDDVFLAQSSSGVPGNDEFGDQLGTSVAIGNVIGDEHADLVAGEPGKDVNGVDSAGQVLVLPGSATGVTTTGSQVRNQDTSGVLDDAEPQDFFGLSLAIGDFGGSAMQDVAIGTPGESVGGDAGAGQVSVLYGSAGGLSVNGDAILNQDRPGMADTSEPGDHFGETLHAAELANGTGADLVAGIPDEDVGSVVDAGAVQIVYSAGGVLTGSVNQVFHQTSTGIPDSSEPSDHFGAGL